MDAKTPKAEKKSFKIDFSGIGEIVREYAETLLVLTFIINGLATLLILFNQVDANEFQRHLVGAVSFAFSFMALVKFTNRGVKHQFKAKKGKK